MTRPSPGILRQLLRRHKGNLSAVVRSLAQGTHGVQPLQVTRQGLTLWLRDADLEDFAASLRPAGQYAGVTRTVDVDRVRRTLRETGTYIEAAQRLGVSVRTLYRWVKEHNIQTGGQ